MVKFTALSYKFSDFTIIDIRVEGLLSMSQLANNQLKWTYSTMAGAQGEHWYEKYEIGSTVMNQNNLNPNLSSTLFCYK